MARRASKPAARTGTRRKKPPQEAPADVTVFVVRDGGTLDLDGEPDAMSRMDAYCLSADAFSDPASLVSAAEEVEPLLWELADAYRDHQEANDDTSGPDDPEADDLLEFLTSLSKADFRALRTRILAWANDEPDFQLEEDHFIDPLADTQETALQFFRDELDQKTRDLLGIRIVEGEFPGSTYYAAELTIEPVEATRRAAAAGVPVRFVRRDPR